MGVHDRINVECPNPDCSNTETVPTKGRRHCNLTTWDLDEAPAVAIVDAAEHYGPTECSDCGIEFDLEIDVTPRVVSENHTDVYGSAPPRGPVGVSFQEDLNRLLDEHDVIQTELADALDVSDQLVSDWVHGRRLVSPEAACKIADYFNLDETSRPWDWLVHQLYTNFQNAQDQIDSSTVNNR